MNNWLDKYEQGGMVLKQKTQDNYGKKANPNNPDVSLPPGFKGLAYNTQGRNYSPAWGGQFQDGGNLTFLEPTSRKLPKGYVIPYNTPSTELAISVGGEDGEPAYLIPSFKYGKYLIDKDAKAEFRKTGEHLGGPFKTWQEADEWERTVRHPYVEKGQSIPTPFRRWGKDFAMGGSLPGSVGFTYARTAGAAPSNGPYAKKTKASAQNGKPIKKREDFEPWWNWASKKAGDVDNRQDAFGTLGDLYAYYAGQPLHYNTLEHSQYKPTDAKNPNASYISINDPKFKQEVFDKYQDVFIKGKLKTGDVNKGEHPWNKEEKINDNTYAVSGYTRPTKEELEEARKQKVSPAFIKGKNHVSNAIGRYFISKGKDDKGEYISYYDVFDEGSGPDGGGMGEKLGLTKPFEIYDRIYLDPKTGKPKMQNGGEMKFYQEGLDWKPRNISRDGSEIPQAQLGLHMLTPDYNQVGENIMEMLSFPQKALTKLFSGKYQAPSEALGIKNKVGAIATDILLDPANLVGGTTAAKIAKGVKAAKAANSVAKKVKPNFKSEIDWAKWNKEIPENTQLMNEYNAIEQSTKKAGTWMKNPDGSTFKGTPEQFVQQNSKNFKKAFGNSKLVNPDGSPTIQYHGSAKNFDTFDESKFQLGDSGYSGRGIYTTPDKTKASSYALSSKSIHTGEYEPTVYELYGQGNNPISAEDLIKQNKDYDLFNFHRAKNWQGDVPLEQQMLDYDVAIRNQTRGVERISPWNEASELVFPTNKQLKSAVGNNGMFDMTNPNIYKSILPYAVPAAIGAGALQQKKQGGDIKKDDNGYWNPENWGKPVEIGSNEITMQGVYEPLLGVSDTGDTQMMYPGEDYAFDGDYVTEYPVMQQGGRTPIYVDNPKDPRLRAYNDSMMLYNQSKGMIRDLKDYERKYGDPKTGGNLGKFVDQWLGYTDNWYDTKGPKMDPAYNRLTKKNKKAPQPERVYNSRLDPDQVAVEYKKPVQPVQYRAPQPVTPVVEQVAPTPVIQPPVVQKKQNVYEGTPIFAPPTLKGPFVEHPGNYLMGFRSASGDTTYVKPEDYQRFAVPEYGQRYIESKIKKQRNGGVSVNMADQYPIEKLDQSLNFTNYNKPTKGGWLDRYEN